MAAVAIIHRPVSVAVSLGTISHRPRGGEAAYAAQFVWQHPTFIHILEGKVHDVNVLDLLVLGAGAFYVMDRGYLDFSRLFKLHHASAFFITRDKRNMNTHRLYSAPTDRAASVPEGLCSPSSPKSPWCRYVRRLTKTYPRA